MPGLLDTNIVSELPKLRPNPNVLAYLSSQPLQHFFLSTLTIAEIRYGILNAQGKHRQRQLEAWLEDEVRKVFEGRILPITEAVLVRWRVLMEQGRKTGRTYSQPDLILASTALEHDLTFITRNTRDFVGIPGLHVFDPWEQIS